MKILVVCQHFYPENFRINDICFELAKKGHKITVLTGLPNYPKGKVLKDYKFFKNRNQKINGVNLYQMTNKIYICKEQTSLDVSLSGLAFIQANLILKQ